MHFADESDPENRNEHVRWHSKGEVGPNRPAETEPTDPDGAMKTLRGTQSNLDIADINSTPIDRVVSTVYRLENVALTPVGRPGRRRSSAPVAAAIDCG